ncbi:DUF4166 domain-containing protein [Aestuariibius insulae]|uniref:DUF4166 domain-containing protein n=1 Tax=Aestuariibius insulae TaxID=2058287 RepID=UPI00345ED269
MNRSLNIVILGGAGVFGSRLAELLAHDGHTVWIAGRSLQRARDTAKRLNKKAIQLHRGPDLSALDGLFIDALVDAAGPFHAYGDDPYALPRACLQSGIHYLDLSDDAEFCAGISALDDTAKTAGCIALSGVSSTPALSSSAVAHLAKDMSKINTIDTAILPGNRAPRGRSVMASILSQVGTSRPHRIAGQTVPFRSWSSRKSYTLPGGLKRWGWWIETPDQRLLPDAFDAQTGTFRAGLELPIMNHGLVLISRLRAATKAPMPGWVIRLMELAAKALAPFGSDKGGMVVTVTGREDNDIKTKTWSLLAEAGEGPYIPAIPARTLLRHLHEIPPGARPALAERPLEDYTAAMSDLAIRFETHSAQTAPLIPRLLSPAFDTLPDAVKDSHRVHAPRRFEGRASITRGQGLYPLLIALLFRFPDASEDVPVSVVKTPTETGETWTRTFGARSFSSHLSRWAGGLTERFGPMIFAIDLTPQTDRLSWPVTAAFLPGHIPLPAWSLPVSYASETEKDGVFQFDVAIHAPLTKELVVRYQGYLKPV